jgi:hypothetical protein
MRLAIREGGDFSQMSPPAKGPSAFHEKAVVMASTGCLARIKSSFGMNNIQTGHVTCHKEEIQLWRSFGEAQHALSFGFLNVVDFKGIRAG